MMTQPAPQFLTDAFAKIVESTGSEFGVTLIVDGLVVDGILTPSIQYKEWQSRQLRISLEVGNGPIEMTSESPSEAMRERLFVEWEERLRAAGATSDDEVSATFDVICLRDAIIESGPRQEWRKIAFLLIEASRVSAMSLGMRNNRG